MKVYVVHIIMYNRVVSEYSIYNNNNVGKLTTPLLSCLADSLNGLWCVYLSSFLP